MWKHKKQDSSRTSLPQTCDRRGVLDGSASNAQNERGMDGFADNVPHERGIGRVCRQCATGEGY